MRKKGGSLRTQLLSRSLLILAVLLALIGLSQYVIMRGVLYKNKADNLHTQVMSIPHEALQQLNGSSSGESGPGRPPFFFSLDASMAFVDLNGNYTVLSNRPGSSAKPLFRHCRQTAIKEGIYMKIKKAVIPAAGLGTRFLPAIKAASERDDADRRQAGHPVHRGRSGAVRHREHIVVTGRNKRSIEDHFDRSIELEQTLSESGKEEMPKTVREISQMASIHFMRQNEPLGLGHAVLCAQQFIGDEPFAVLLGDDIMISEKPALRQLMDVYEAFDADVIGVQLVAKHDVRKYGIVSPYSKALQTTRHANKLALGRAELRSDLLAYMESLLVEEKQSGGIR